MTDAMPNAMVLAAGRGERLRPITESQPKPLVAVRGAALLDWALNRLATAGVRSVVINTHYLGHMIADHVAGRAAPAITLSPETERLDTGGGVANALTACPDVLPGREDGFFVLNSDVVLLDGPTPSLHRMLRFWDPTHMDALLLVQPIMAVVGHAGGGDFFMDAKGCLTRPGGRQTPPFLFTGTQILHPRLFEDAPEGSFSLNRLYNAAMAEERLFGLRHEGLMFHVGTPDALEATRRYVNTPESMIPLLGPLYENIN